MVAPVVAEIAEENAGKIKAGKVNVDEQPELTSAFKISSIPTLMGFKGGKITAMEVGYRDKEDIEALI